MNSKSRILTVIVVTLSCIAAVLWLDAGDLNPPPGPVAPSGPSLSDLAVAIDELKPVSPANLVELGSPVVTVGNNQSLLRINADAANIGAFTVPVGKTFIMTDLTVHPETFGGTPLAIGINQGGLARKFFRFPADRPFQLHLRSGLPFSSGSALNVDNDSAVGATGFRVFMSGYLVDNP